MEKKLEKIFKKAQEVRLSENEKAVGLKNIRQIISQEGSTPVKSPYFIREFIFDPVFGWRFRKKVGFMVFALLITLYGGMTSFAARTTVPGDALYPVKVNFNERLHNFFALGEKQRIRVETEHALARLQEIEKLLKMKPTDEQVKKQATETFEKNKQILIELSNKQGENVKDYVMKTIENVSNLMK
jgi:hypothetical protein